MWRYHRAELLVLFAVTMDAMLVSLSVHQFTENLTKECNGQVNAYALLSIVFLCILCLCATLIRHSFSFKGFCRDTE